MTHRLCWIAVALTLVSAASKAHAVTYEQVANSCIASTKQHWSSLDAYYSNNTIYWQGPNKALFELHKCLRLNGWEWKANGW